MTWKLLSHPNVLELFGVTMDDTAYTTVTPWMENGTIIDFLRENPQANPLKLARPPVFCLIQLFIELGHS